MFVSMSGKSPQEVERANRLFAVENAVKLGVKEGGPPAIEVARQIFAFLQENKEIPDNPVGFTGGSGYE